MCATFQKGKAIIIYFKVWIENFLVFYCLRNRDSFQNIIYDLIDVERVVHNSLQQSFKTSNNGFELFSTYVKYLTFENVDFCQINEISEQVSLLKLMQEKIFVNVLV